MKNLKLLNKKHLSIVLLNKIDFPSPNKEIKKFIPNDNLKIVK